MTWASEEDLRSVPNHNICLDRTGYERHWVAGREPVNDDRHVEGRTIREAEQRDVGPIIDLRHRAFERFAPGVYSPEEVVTLLADVDVAEIETMIGREQLFVAVSQGVIVGTAGWMGGSLRHCYVEPDLARQGIGSHLVKHVEGDYFARTKAKEIALGAVLYAVEFYRANGYEVVERTTAWDGSAMCSMRKTVVT